MPQIISYYARVCFIALSSAGPCSDGAERSMCSMFWHFVPLALFLFFFFSEQWRKHKSLDRTVCTTYACHDWCFPLTTSPHTRHPCNPLYKISDSIENQLFVAAEAENVAYFYASMHVQVGPQMTFTSTPLTLPSTHRIPHDDVDVCTEGVVDVLWYVEIDKVTEVVVHVHTWSEKTTTISHRRSECTLNGDAQGSVFLLMDWVLRFIPASSFMKTVGFSTIMSQCPLSNGWESSCVNVCSSAYLKRGKIHKINNNFRVHQ